MSAHRDRLIRLLLVCLITGAMLAVAAHGHERIGDDADCVLCILAAGLAWPVALIVLTGILISDPGRIPIRAIAHHSACISAPCGLRAPPASR